MSFRNRNRQFNRTLFFAMLFVALGGSTRLFLQHHLPLSENLVDGIIGLFYGLSFGLFFLGFRQNRRQCARDN
jgi:membrane-anchored protein YejM (alkaline phosphatase superfamily)